MSRLIRATLMALALVLGPQVAVAQTAQRDMTFEEVRTALIGAGYDPRLEISWPGFNPSSDLLRVSVDAMLDEQPTSLWVFVYRTTAAADAAHRMALAQAQARLDHLIPDSNRRGPQLLTGYGASYWWRNLAVVQQAEPDDDAAWLQETDDGLALLTNAALAHEPVSQEGLPRTAVSQTFIDVLQSALARTVESTDTSTTRHVVDRWYLEPSTVAVTGAQPRRVADRWYLEPTSVLAAPAVSAQARDRWYLDAHSNDAAPAQTRHVVDRWYLEP